MLFPWVMGRGKTWHRWAQTSSQVQREMRGAEPRALSISGTSTNIGSGLLLNRITGPPRSLWSMFIGKGSPRSLSPHLPPQNLSNWRCWGLELGPSSALESLAMHLSSPTILSDWILLGETIGPSPLTLSSSSSFKAKVFRSASARD